MDDVEDSESAHTELDVAFCANLAGGARWIAMFRGTPVASVSREQSGKNKDLFDTANFGQVVIASAKHVGVRKTLEELGFRPYIRTIAISSIVDQLAADKIAEATDELETVRESYVETLQAALASAAVGINRGFFVDVQNPLKDALYSALSTAGIKNPGTIIANVFRETADTYHKVLFAKANDIMANPPEVQTSLAKAIMGTAYSESSDNNGTTHVDDLLGNMGTVVSSAAAHTIAVQETESVSADYDERTAAVIAGLGRRR